MNRFIHLLIDRCHSHINLPCGLVIVNRGYLIGNKWVRFHVMRGANGVVGYKIAAGVYEVRYYK